MSEIASKLLSKMHCILQRQIGSIAAGSRGKDTARGGETASEKEGDLSDWKGILIVLN